MGVVDSIILCIMWLPYSQYSILIINGKLERYLLYIYRLRHHYLGPLSYRLLNNWFLHVAIGYNFGLKIKVYTGGYGMSLLPCNIKESPSPKRWRNKVMDFFNSSIESLMLSAVCCVGVAIRREPVKSLYTYVSVNVECHLYVIHIMYAL